jgi:hypothetical protein
MSLWSENCRETVGLALLTAVNKSLKVRPGIAAFQPLDFLPRGRRWPHFQSHGRMTDDT